MGLPPRWIYVLESVSDPSRHYTGLSSDVDARLAWHNAGLSPHTVKHRPWRVLVAMQFADAKMAIRFEKYLKSGSGRAFATTLWRPHGRDDDVDVKSAMPTRMIVGVRCR
jgi:putative endonuclease